MDCGSKAFFFFLWGRHKSEARWAQIRRSRGWFEILCPQPVLSEGANKGKQDLTGSLGESWENEHLGSPWGIWTDWCINQNTNAFIYKEDSPCQMDQMFMWTDQRILSCWKIYMESQIIIQRLFVSMKSEQSRGNWMSSVASIGIEGGLHICV